MVYIFLLLDFYGTLSGMRRHIRGGRNYALPLHICRYSFASKVVHFEHRLRLEIVVSDATTSA